MTKIYKGLRKYWKIYVFTLSILIFGTMIFLLLTNNVRNFDNFIYNIVYKLRSTPSTYFFRFVSFFCSTLFLFLAALAIIIFIKNKKYAFFIDLNIFLCFLLNQIFKVSFARNRPIDINLIVENGYSFPSGHSMLSLAFYGFFIYIIVHNNWSQKNKLLCVALLTLLILLIGISRIYLGVHFASDVLAGYALSMAYLIIYIKLFYKKMGK